MADDWMGTYWLIKVILVVAAAIDGVSSEWMIAGRGMWVSEVIRRPCSTNQHNVGAVLGALEVQGQM